MTKTKKKELKKLENIIANVHPFYVETIAEKLIKKGYGNVKGYQKEIAELQKDVKRLRAVIAMIEQHFVTRVSFEYDFDEYIKEAKQEAVKEFAEKLKDKFNDYEATSYNGCEEGWHDLQEEIDELLKEYGE